MDKFEFIFIHFKLKVYLYPLISLHNKYYQKINLVVDMYHKL